MRPLALRLQAFGSYAGELTVDFARLGRHGVFSITGPTGAGKSTIFDAIVYALYDDLPGFRVNSHIRSQFAPPGTRTEVTLEFEAEGRHWILTRWPAQSRPRARGSAGTVEDTSKVVLAEHGVEGGAVTRKRDVADRVAQLVGLDKAQFEQVVLIPQGKFEEVLKARTQERADLLARLFPVDVYVRTTEALRRVATERGAAYEELTRDRRAAEDRIRADVAAFRAEAHRPLPGAPPEPPDAADDHGGTDAADATPDDDGGEDGLDLSRLPEVRAALAAELDVVTAARDSASGVRAAAQATRAAVEAAVVRWEAWRRDLAEAEVHPAEEAADAEAAADLERAATVAALSTTLDAWRSATDRLASLDGARSRLRSAVDAAWVDGYDRAALDSPTSAHLLGASVAADADALEAADRRHAELVAQGRAVEAEERVLADRTEALDRAVEDLARSRRDVAGTEALLATDIERAGERPAAAARLERLEEERATVAARADTEALLSGLALEAEASDRRRVESLARADALRAAWRSGLAGRLAAHLHDGAPCPTCGSTEHPDPAVPADDAPGDEELDAAERAATAAGDARQELELRIAEARSRLATLPVVPDAADLDVRLAAAAAELAAIDADGLTRAARAEDLERQRAAVAGAAAAVDTERAALAGAAGALAERRSRWEADREEFVAEHGGLVSTAGRAAGRRALAGAVSDLAANLEATASAAAARAGHGAALAPTLAAFGVDDPAGLARWARSEQAVADARAALADRAERRHEVAVRIAAYRADGGPEECPDVAPVLVAEHDAGAAHDDLVGRVATMAGRLAAIDASAAALADGAAAVAAARSAKEEADTLAGLCAGSGSGPDATRLSLKNWVLAYYLRQVLAHANRRLDTMTSGRYALALSEEHADGRRPWGLDISVRDAETGQSRPATTLSGGETFMAALALALGLADVVSAGSDYSIGALFVDEGFGSLDGDSLDTVIDVLRSLQDGGRMVGVISHVQELKDALPDGITIESTNRGSLATLHYPDP